MRSLVAKRDAKGTWKSLIAVVSVVPKVTEKQKQISEQITAVTTKSKDAFEWRWGLYDSGFQAKTGVGSDDIKVVLISAIHVAPSSQIYHTPPIES